MFAVGMYVVYCNFYIHFQIASKCDNRDSTCLIIALVKFLKCYITHTEIKRIRSWVTRYM